MTLSTALTIYNDISRDELAKTLAVASDQEKASAIADLALRGEAELINYLDEVVLLLRQTQSAEVKCAICQAVRAAGASGVQYAQEITNLLYSSESNVKVEACATLAPMGTYAAGATSAVVPLLSHQVDAVRCGACAALGGIQAKDCADDLAKMLSDPSPEVQGAACVALGRLGVDGEKNAAEVAAKLAEPRSRLAAINALAMMGREGAKHCEAICDCLADEDAEVRVAAATVVGQMGDAVKESPAAFSRVLEILGHEDGRFRAAAAMAVGHLGIRAQEQGSVLQDLLSDGFQESAVNALTVGGCRVRLPTVWRKTRCAAAVALGMLAKDGADGEWDRIAADISKMLEDDDWEVRLAACDALALMGDNARGEALKVAGLFEDEKYPVRAKAAHACGKIREPDVVADLADLLQDGCPAVREEALLALAELGEDGTEFIAQVYEHIMDFSPNVRAAAVTALGRMGEKGQLYAGAVAQRLLQNETVNVRLAAIEALGLMEEHGAVYADVVAEYLQDQVPQVRAAAAKSLGRMGPEAGVYTGAIKALTYDPCESVKKVAGEALQGLGGY